MTATRKLGSFDSSPFALTADPNVGASWAGRPEVLQRVRRVIRGFESRSDATLDLIWANFGAGKSHALYHIAHLLSDTNTRATTVFVEIPEQLRHFIDLYRRILPLLPWDAISKGIVDSNVKGVSGDLKRAARVIAYGGDRERAIALEWLAAGRPHLKELRTYTGISTRIEDDAHATDMLSDIVRVGAENKCRIVMLLDEFQRLGSLQERYRSAVLSSIRSLFSRNPAYFSVIAAATTRVERTALDMLPQELRTIMGIRPSISLPEMSEEEAFIFTIERFKCFRAPGYSGAAGDPLGEDAVRAAIKFIAEETKAPLIPRTILQALSWIYDETNDGPRPVAPAKVRDLLKELPWDSMLERPNA